MTAEELLALAECLFSESIWETISPDNKNDILIDHPEYCEENNVLKVYWKERDIIVNLTDKDNIWFEANGMPIGYSTFKRHHVST